MLFTLLLQKSNWKVRLGEFKSEFKNLKMFWQINIEEVVLCKALCLKWSVKKRCVANAVFMKVIVTIFAKNIATSLLLPLF